MSSAVLVPRLPDPSSSFREDAPRPPVPGEEGETPPCQPGVGKGPAAKAPPVSPSARRNEGWTKSLHSLLGDQDGAYLFRTFLEREKCVDTLDFWFACNGFRQMNLQDAKTSRVAKAIYKRYIENNSIVSKQLRPATKAYIRDSIKKQQIDSVMFDQAQTEVQALMEENAYQTFLTSDICLEYVGSGGENPAYLSQGGLGSLRLVCGYLPTLNEEEEWTCADFKCKLPPTVVGLSSKTLRATASARAMDTMESGYRSFRRSDPVNPYHVGSGYVFAPAASANDSEISSDALTDDSMSMTDSSVDGVPPYRVGSKKQLQREMHRSVKANGQVSLPHFPVSAPARWGDWPTGGGASGASAAARWGRGSLPGAGPRGAGSRGGGARKSRLHSGSVPGTGGREGPPERCDGVHRGVIPFRGPQDDLCDPLHFLNKEFSKTKKPRQEVPSQKPGPKGRKVMHALCWAALLAPSPRARPLGVRPTACAHGARPGTVALHEAAVPAHKAAMPPRPRAAQSPRGCGPGRIPTPVPRPWQPPDRKHPVSFPRPAENPPAAQGDDPRGACRLRSRAHRPAGEAEAGAGDALSFFSFCSPEAGWRARWWTFLTLGFLSPPFSSSAQSTKRAYPTESARVSPAERAGRHHLWGGGTGHPRTVPRAHPACTQDSAVPPLTPPNTLAQLEEACRRLAEVSKPPKQRCCAAGQQKDRSHPGPGMPGAAPFSSPSPALEDHKEPRKLAGMHALQASELVVTYFFCGEEIPYRRMLKAQSLTLGHFKEQLSKKGNYRYYFKKASDEFACGAVFEEVWDDEVVLPMYEGRILGKVERID
ncbi:hypothetical protein K5549_013808 [Capra hircus]|nr:hypothetical protein K5549_013808 [Capra hircus]